MKIDENNMPHDIKRLVEQRIMKKSEEKYEEADKLREEIKGLGYEMKDVKGGGYEVWTL